MALLKIDEMVERMARLSGHREVYLLCKDDRVSDLCTRHGFEELTGYRMLRKKVSAELTVADGVVVQ